VNWLSRFDEAVNFDSTQYTFDRVNALRRELTTLKSRVERLEVESDQVPGDSSTKVAA
jgi:hypothetical protein